jgi:hypothetical protein
MREFWRGDRHTGLDCMECMECMEMEMEMDKSGYAYDMHRGRDRAHEGISIA